MVLEVVLEKDLELLEHCLELKIILLHELLDAFDSRVFQALKDLLLRCLLLSGQIGEG